MNIHNETLKAIENPLVSKAMLATVKISQWSGRKLDKQVTADTNRAHNADSDAGRFNKALVSKSAMARIAKVSGKIRTEFYFFTMPWLDDGSRILPAKSFDAFTASIEKLRVEFDKEVSAFLSEYQASIDESRIRLGDMFHSSDYPSHDEIAKRFNCDIGFSNMPNGADFRAGVSHEQAQAIANQIETRTKQALADAMADTWSRVFDKVSAMAGKLAAYTPAQGQGKASGVFRDSLVTNLQELVSILPALNIADNPAMDKVTKDIEESLCHFSASELREDSNLRHETAQAANNILATVSDFI